MTIYFIRHGQSEFNAAHADGGPDPMIYDAPLTARGREQARAARTQVADLGIEQVITSPLTRAVETALHIFEGIAPIRVSAQHRELLLHSCDVGRHPEYLQRDFPMLDFEHLPERWWHHHPDDAADAILVEPKMVFLRRIADFKNGLDQVEERPLAIVGHGNVFRALIGQVMDNCEIHRFQTDKN